VVVTAIDLEVSPTTGVTAAATSIGRASRNGGIRALTTELTFVCYVTHMSVEAGEAVLVANREPEAGPALDEGVDTNIGRSRKKTEEEAVKQVNSQKSANKTGGKGGDAGNVVECLRHSRTKIVMCFHAYSPARRDRAVDEEVVDIVIGGALRQRSSNTEERMTEGDLVAEPTRKTSHKILPN
jgi:hypothetical protein